MRKYILLIISIIVLFITNYIYAGDYYEYKWTNTYVNVEKYDDISKYTSKPQATLYKNGAKLDDALITYNTNGDWLYYLKDVDTTKIGEYKVWYKVNEVKYNPGTCNNYKAIVTFNIVDNSSKLDITICGSYDNVLNSKVIQISVNSKKVNYIDEGLILIKSDYKYEALVDDSNVNYQVPGVYKCLLYCVDHNNKKYNVEFYVKVVDNISPTVNKKKDLITIEKSNRVINWDDYIKIEDNIIDKYTYELLNVDYTILDKVQKCKLVVTDTHGNSTSIEFDIIVKDSIKPIIALREETIILEYNKEYDVNYFKQYIDSALDGDIDLTDKVVIDISKLGKAVGIYSVYFTVTDSDNNMDMKELVVTIKSLIPPKIEVTNVTIKVNEKPDYTKYVKVTDPSDPNIMNSLIFDDSKVDYTKPGTYYVTVSVENTYGDPVSDYIKVTVESDNKKLNIIKIIAFIGVIVIVSGSIIYKKRKDKEEINIVDI